LCENKRTGQPGPFLYITSNTVMPGSIRIGRLGGTDIGVHVTFLPVLVWAAWIGTVQYGGLWGATFGVLAVVMLFGCVFLHEVAHSLQANARGVGVQYIVLLPLGGLANLQTGSIKPRDEIAIALAGPLANLLLGLLFGALSFGVAMISSVDLKPLIFQSLREPSMLGLMAYLSLANLILAAFNVLPAFPLDGGRALRALLSTRMPYEAATHRAAIIGRAFGAGLAAIGIGIAALGSISSGLALIIAAAVLYGGATYEDRMVLHHATLNHVTVEQVLRPIELTVRPDEPLSVALESLAKGQVVPVVIGERSRLIGLVTTSDLSGLSRNGALSSLNIAHVMRTRFPTVRATDPLWVAHRKLQHSRLFAIPVMDRDILRGWVTLSDIHQVLRKSAALVKETAQSQPESQQA
jgi:Zn-dependent protease/predicted transcriptional regulator